MHVARVPICQRGADASRMCVRRGSCCACPATRGDTATQPAAHTLHFWHALPVQGFEKTGLGERVANIFVRLFGKSTLVRRGGGMGGRRAGWVHGWWMGGQELQSRWHAGHHAGCAVAHAQTMPPQCPAQPPVCPTIPRAWPTACRWRRPLYRLPCPPQPRARAASSCPSSPAWRTAAAASRVRSCWVGGGVEVAGKQAAGCLGRCMRSAAARLADCLCCQSQVRFSNTHCPSFPPLSTLQMRSRARSWAPTWCRASCRHVCSSCQAVV